MKIGKLPKRAALGLLVTTGLAGLMALGPPAYVKIQDYVNRSRIEEKLTYLEEKLSGEYKISIRVWEESDMLGGRPVPKEQTSLRSFSPYVSLKALEDLEEALGCYPRDIIERTFSGIEIVKSFTNPWYDEAREKQKITKIAKISFGNNISISVGRNNLSIYHQALLGNVFEEENLHHEIGHELTGDIPEDEWRSLNPDAKYFSGDSWRSLPEVPTGFYNIYATSSVREDIASTLELLYSDRSNYKKRTSQDPVLRLKAEFLMKWYHKISDGRFNQEYWNAVQSGETPFI